VVKGRSANPALISSQNAMRGKTEQDRDSGKSGPSIAVDDQDATSKDKSNSLGS